MHSCRLLMEIPSMERHRTVHDIIAIGVLKGVGGEQQFRILRNFQNNFFFSRSIDSSDQSNQSRKIDRQKMIFSNWMMAICKNRTKNLKSKWQSRVWKNWKKKNEKNRLFQFSKGNVWNQRKIPDFESPKLSGKWQCSWHETKRWLFAKNRE